MLSVEALGDEFSRILGVPAPTDHRLVSAARCLLSELAHQRPVSKSERAQRLVALINAKFGVNASALAELYGRCASQGATFNYHEKMRLAGAFDRSDRATILELLSRKGLDVTAVAADLCPASQEMTLKRLHDEIASPTLVRRDSKPRDWSQEIRRALFGGFVFYAYPTPVVHKHFDPDAAHSDYEPDFWRHLHRSRPNLFSRDRTLTYLKVPRDTTLEDLAAPIKNEFELLANHGYLALHMSDWGGDAWRAAGHFTLYAEKFLTLHVTNAFYRRNDIEEVTRSYTNNADPDLGFETVDYGFQYRDTFVFGNGAVTDLVLLFQKNYPDETLIPCPACRSHNVQGNSY